MPGGLVEGCSSKLAGAASYFPCTAWLWPEDAAEESRPILQAPTQNLAEALIPPTQLGIVHQDGDLSNNTQWGSNGAGAASMTASPVSKASKQKAKQSVRTEGEGIELKTAAANPFLGQAHLQSRGRFVEAQPGKMGSVTSSNRKQPAVV